MSDENSRPQRVYGRVKWFDPVKGFGFVVTDEGGPDILLHANVLRNFGQSSVADQAGIDLEVQRTQRGIQATEVFAIDPPAQDTMSELADIDNIDLETLRDAPLEPARVKWFDKGKGFGFANVFGDDRDVFLHIEVLRRSGLSDLATGEAVGMRMMSGTRGMMAIEITSWEVGNK